MDFNVFDTLIETALLLFASIMGLFLKLIPFPSEFIVALDTAISALANMYYLGSWLIPTDLLFYSLSIILAVKNRKLILQLVKFILRLIPGLG